MTAKRTLVVVRSQTNAPLRGGCGDEWYDDDDGEVVMWWPAVVVSVGVARGGEWYSGSDRSGGEEDFGAPSENSPENFSVTGYHCSCGVRWEVVFWGAISSRDNVDEMCHGSYDVPRSPTICSANGNGNGDGNGFNLMCMSTDRGMNRPIVANYSIFAGPSMPNPVTSAVTVAAQLGRRFPVPRFNLSCCSITETVTPDSIIELLRMSL
ncbi:hypothetical protein Tco_0415487 [Tanacetum coccineum]